MAEKKGLMHYLANPAEAAKKLFPFIDVDTMMASNRERQIELGNNPDVASNIMGAALNPIGLATGYGASKLMSGLMQKAYTGMSKRNIAKDLLSDKSFGRYKSNFKYQLDEMNKALDSEKMGLESVAGKGFFTDDLLTKKMSEIGKKRKEIRETLDSLDKDDFRMMYNKIVEDKISKTPFRYPSNLPPNTGGQYVGNFPLNETLLKTKPFQYNPRSPEQQKQIYKGFIDIDPSKVKKMGTTGAHELKHSVQSALKGYIKKAEDILDWPSIQQRTRDKLEWGRQIGMTQDKLQEIKDHVKYISNPQELSARLTEFRLNPKRKDMVYRELKHLFGSDRKIKEAADTVWAGIPVSLMDYANRNK